MTRSAAFDVCLLTTGFPRFEGDLFGTFVFELARTLVRQGATVVVLAPHDRHAAREEIVEGVHVHRFRYFVPRWQRLAYGGGMPTNLRQSWVARLQVPLFLLAFAVHARRLARHSRVLHCQWTISGLVGYLATLSISFRGARCPVVLTVRGSDFHLARSGIGARVNRFVYRHMAAVLTVSHDLCRQLAADGVDASRLHVVTNGVDERFHPGDGVSARQQLALPAEGVIILFVGMMVPVKGLEHLLNALEQLQDLPFSCILLGDGPQQAQLSSRAKDAGLTCLQWAGRRPAGEIPLWMQAADMLVLPSLSEGRPNVVLEAQACALPVVATAVGGTPELVQDQVNGLLVPAGDSVALAAALRRLIDDGDLRQRLGQAGRTGIEQGAFSWSSTATRTQAIYDAVLVG